MNGEPDETEAIRAAIEAAKKAGGGRVLLGPGIHRITETIEVCTDRPGDSIEDGITIEGAGMGATHLVADFAEGDVIRFVDTHYGGVRDLSITAPVHRASGSGIHLAGTYHTRIADVQMQRQAIGIEISGRGMGHYVERALLNDFAREAVGIWLRSTTTNETHLDDVFVIGDGVDGNHTCAAGVRIQGTEAVWMTDCDVILCNHGLLMDPDEGHAIFGFFERCAFDSCARHAIRIEPTGSGRVGSMHFSTCWSASSGSDTCRIAGAVDGVEFVGHRFKAAVTGSGLRVVGANNVYADACVAAGNRSGSGFLFEGCAANFAVRNSRAGPYGLDPSGNAVGVAISPGCNGYVISGNNLRGNKIGFLEPGRGTSRQVFGNLT